MNKQKQFVFVIFILFFFSLWFRINGLFDNHPFWVDEFSTANQAELLKQHGFQVFTDSRIFFETNKLTSSVLALAGIELFGKYTSSARFFFALIGATIPVLIFLIAKRIGTASSAIPAFILSSTSYLLITWSRQARSYSITIALTLLAYYIYTSIINKGLTRRLGTAYILVSAIGVFTHPFFYIVLASQLAAAIYYYVKSEHSKDASILIFSGGIALAAILFISIDILSSVKYGIVNVSNNVWLYHAYLWREYSLITYVGSIGILLGFIRKPSYFAPVVVHILLHLVFINFFFATATSRYILPIFPWFLIGFAYVLGEMCNVIFAKRSKKVRYLAPIVLALALIVNGYKFDVKPNRYYSVNHDFREIALIDYDNLYSIVIEKGGVREGKTDVAVIDTWADRASWYVGNYPSLYNFRWKDDGVMKRTPTHLNENGEEVLTGRESVGYIGSEEDLVRATEKHDKGFLIIDDTSLPQDVIDYAEHNFAKELYLERYVYDDNPLSAWPITLYSWGFADEI